MTTLTRIQMVVYLQSVELFTHCTAEQMVRIADIARQKALRRQTPIYAVNDTPEALYCVVEGSVDLLNADGTPVRRIAPGGTFGVREILSGRLRRDQAVATRDGIALEIDAEDFFDLLSNNIEIVKALFRQLLRAPHEVNPQATETSLSPTPSQSTGGPHSEISSIR